MSKATEQVHVRCTPAEIRYWKKAARAQRMSLSQYIRMMLGKPPATYKEHRL